MINHKCRFYVHNKLEAAHLDKVMGNGNGLDLYVRNAKEHYDNTITLYYYPDNDRFLFADGESTYDERINTLEEIPYINPITLDLLEVING